MSEETSGREASCAHVLLSDERCDVCGEFVASTAGRKTAADERCACGRTLTDAGTCSLCEYVPERCNCVSAGRENPPARACVLNIWGVCLTAAAHPDHTCPSGREATTRPAAELLREGHRKTHPDCRWDGPHYVPPSMGEPGFFLCDAGMNEPPAPTWDGVCGRGGEDLPCTCYQGPDFSEMTRPELEAAAERWRQRAIEAERNQP